MPLSRPRGTVFCGFVGLVAYDDGPVSEVQRIFDGAPSERPAERAAFLARACGEDIELRQRVESLLAFSENEDSFFDPSHLPTLELKEAVE